MEQESQGRQDGEGRGHGMSLTTSRREHMWMCQWDLTCMYTQEVPVTDKGAEGRSVEEKGDEGGWEEREGGDEVRFLACGTLSR